MLPLSWLEGVISFLLGVLWTLLVLTAILTFIALFKNGVLFALVVSIITASIWLIFIVLLEMANLQIEKLKELKKQTKLLQAIKNSLK